MSPIFLLIKILKIINLGYFSIIKIINLRLLALQIPLTFKEIKIDLDRDKASIYFNKLPKIKGIKIKIIRKNWYQFQ